MNTIWWIYLIHIVYISRYKQSHAILSEIYNPSTIFFDNYSPGTFSKHNDQSRVNLSEENSQKEYLCLNHMGFLNYQASTHISKANFNSLQRYTLPINMQHAEHLADFQLDPLTPKVLRQSNRHLGGKRLESLLKEVVAIKQKERADQSRNLSETNRPTLQLNRLPISLFKEGQVLNGRIINVKKYGLWVDIGCTKNGFLHLRDISEDWIEDIHSVFTKGQELLVKIKFIDAASEIIGLCNANYKAGQHSRENTIEALSLFNVEDRLMGKVKKITKFGVFVDINGQIDAFLHVRDIHHPITGGKRRFPSDYYKINDIIEPVYVKVVDLVRKRLQLSTRSYEEELNLRLDLGLETHEEQENYAPSPVAIHQKISLDRKGKFSFSKIGDTLDFKRSHTRERHVSPWTAEPLVPSFGLSTDIPKGSTIDIDSKNTQRPVKMEKNGQWGYSSKDIENAIIGIRSRLDNYSYPDDEEDYGDSFETNILNNFRIVLSSKEDEYLDKIKFDLNSFISDIDKWDEDTEMIAPLIFRDKNLLRFKNSSLSESPSLTGNTDQNFFLNEREDQFKGLSIIDSTSNITINNTDCQAHENYFGLFYNNENQSNEESIPLPNLEESDMDSNQLYQSNDQDVDKSFNDSIRPLNDTSFLSSKQKPDSPKRDTGYSGEQPFPNEEHGIANVKKEAHLYINNLINKITRSQDSPSTNSAQYIYSQAQNHRFNQNSPWPYQNSVKSLINSSQQSSRANCDLNARFFELGIDSHDGKYDHDKEFEFHSSKIMSQPDRFQSTISSKKFDKIKNNPTHSKWLSEYVDQIMLRTKHSDSLPATVTESYSLSDKLKTPFYKIHNAKDLDRIKIRALLNDKSFQDLLKLSGIDPNQLREDFLDIKMLEDFPKKFIFKRPNVKGI